MLKQIIIGFFVLLSLISFSQNELRTVSIKEKVDISSDLKTLKFITITLKDFSETDTEFFIEKSKKYSHYITLTQVSKNKFKIEMLGTDGWKYVARFFITAQIQAIKSNKDIILINDFIKM